jgi:hypothetical protein
LLYENSLREIVGKLTTLRRDNISEQLSVVLNLNLDPVEAKTRHVSSLSPLERALVPHVLQIQGNIPQDGTAGELPWGSLPEVAVDSVIKHLVKLRYIQRKRRSQEYELSPMFWRGFNCGLPLSIQNAIELFASQTQTVLNINSYDPAETLALAHLAADARLVATIEDLSCPNATETTEVIQICINLLDELKSCVGRE